MSASKTHRDVGRDFGEPHHAYVSVNLSRTFLVEALSAYYRAKRDAHDGRHPLHVKTFHDRVLEFARTHLYGLEELDSARVLQWYLSTDEVRLAPDFLDYNLNNDSASAWLNINMNPTKATRGDVLRAVYRERDWTKLDVDDEASWGYSSKYYRDCVGRNDIPSATPQYSDARSPLAGPAPNAHKIIPQWGENDKHAGKTLEQAKDEAAEIRERMGMDLPAGARRLPSVDVGHDECSLPPAPSEPACLHKAMAEFSDDRDRQALLTFLEHRGYRPSDPVRFDAKAAKDKVIRQRESAEQTRQQRTMPTAQDNAGLYSSDDDDDEESVIAVASGEDVQEMDEEEEEEDHVDNMDENDGEKASGVEDAPAHAPLSILGVV